MLITVYSLSRTYNLPRAEKKREVTIYRNTTRTELLKTRKQYSYKKDYLEGLIYNTLLSIYDLQLIGFLNRVLKITTQLNPCTTYTEKKKKRDRPKCRIGQG